MITNIINAATLFEELDELILRIIALLKKQRSFLGKNRDNIQRVSDIQQGLVYQKGIYLPLKSVEYRILFDGYEVAFLDVFISLHERIFSEGKDNIFTQFSLRTLFEMGFPRAQMLFSKSLSESEKNKYKLLLMLADYGSMGFNNKQHVAHFQKLYDYYGGLLTENQHKILKDLLNSIKNGDRDKHINLTQKARKLIESVQDSLFQKTPMLSIFGKRNIKAMFSGFSHILHGNIFLILDILSSKRPNQLKLRVYWFLLLTGINVVNQLANNIDNKPLNNEVLELNKDFVIIAEKVKNFWEQL